MRAHETLSAGFGRVLGHRAAAVPAGFFRIGALDKVARLQRDSHDGLEVFPLTEGIAMTAARVDAELKRVGTPVEIADVFIAASAIDPGWPLVTSNTKHFGLIQQAGFGLELEDWRA